MGQFVLFNNSKMDWVLVPGLHKTVIELVCIVIRNVNKLNDQSACTKTGY